MRPIVQPPCPYWMIIKGYPQDDTIHAMNAWFKDNLKGRMLFLFNRHGDLNVSVHCESTAQLAGSHLIVAFEKEPDATLFRLTWEDALNEDEKK